MARPSVRSFHSLQMAIARLTDRDYILYASGVDGYFHLGEVGVPDLHLIAAGEDEVLAWIDDQE